MLDRLKILEKHQIVLKFFNYSSCTTCKKAIKWLRSQNISFELVEIVSEPPSISTLISAGKAFGDRKYLLNTSGSSYRSLGAKVVKDMSDEEFFEALFYDPKLIKRPFLSYSNDSYLIGFKEEEWAEKLL